MGSLFNLTERAAIGIHAVILIARNQGGMTAKAVAESLNVSQDHTVKVLNRLSRSGILRAVRGPNGGFSLKVLPENLTLLNVYESIDGPLQRTGCLFREMKCGPDECLFGGLITAVNDLTRLHFESQTIAELMGGEK